jgi:hypothetical protein
MPSALSNFFVSTIIRSPLHAMVGPGMALIRVRGRKSGREIVTPINVVAEGDGFTATSLRRRTWWRNLRGGAAAELRVGGRQQAVQGEVVEDQAAVIAGFGRYFDAHPKLARFFGVRPGADGGLARQDLERLAAERVIIHLRPPEGARRG